MRIARAGRAAYSRLSRARRLRALFVAACWAAAVGLVVVAGLRVVAHDRAFPLVLLDAYTFWIYLPAYLVVVASIVTRRWRLAVLAAVAIACHLWWVLPDYGGAEPIPAEAATAPHLRLFTANLRWDNPNPEAIIDELKAANPDIAFLEEFTPRAQAWMFASGLADALPFQVRAARNDGFGIAVYSRFPLDDAEIWHAEQAPIIRGFVLVGGKRVRFYAVHPTSPSSFHNFDHWNAQWSALIDALSAEPNADLVVAGDFNSTQHNRWYQAVADLSLTDAHRQRGQGNAASWPNRKALLLRPIRIDQVFISDDIVCLDIREGTGQGSDHRPVIADFAFIR